jgi:hypothetical protein
VKDEKLDIVVSPHYFPVVPFETGKGVILMNGDTPTAINADAEGDDESQGRQRSKVAFPYSDLNAAIEVANAIHDKVGNGDCSLQQLSAWMNQSIKSSGFRVQLAASRLFGVIESEGTESYRLTILGRRLMDPVHATKGKADAFLNVPLFKLLYDNHKEGVLPPTAALEREIANLGVAEKQKDRARQVFERSADQAGFFEHGRNRLVMPAVSIKKEQEHKESGSGHGGGDGGGPDDPLLSALIQKLPKSGAQWSVGDRVMWLNMIAMAFQMAYGQEPPIEIRAAKESA